MSDLPKISIIVPVYKAEKYLHQCVDSILEQTFTDFELLLIDDGSPDRSGAICDEYAAADPRVRVFHKPNGGVSSARNLGLDNACGEFVSFVDADDEICPRTLEICINKVIENRLDFLQFSFTRTKEYQFETNNNDIVYDRQTFIKERYYLGYVWGSIIRIDIIKTNTIRFDERIKLSEDLLVMMECIRQSNRIMRIYDKLYYYRQNECSATKRTKSCDSLNSIVAVQKYKSLHPEFSANIDNLILYFAGDIIKNHDVSIWRLSKIVCHSDIVYTDLVTRNLALIGKFSRYGRLMTAIAMLIYSIRHK